jgi:Tfp pilus assembly protein PilO
VQAERSPQQFAAALPTRAQIPALLGEVLVQATDSGIVLEQGRYTFNPATSSRLARYTLEFPVKADYGNIRNFINKSLAAIPALGLDKLHVERKNVGDTLVSADVGFVIYLRGA